MHLQMKTENLITCAWCDSPSMQENEAFIRNSLKKQKLITLKCDCCQFCTSYYINKVDVILGHRCQTTYFRNLYKTRPNYVINTKNLTDSIIQFLQAEPKNTNRYKKREVLV